MPSVYHEHCGKPGPKSNEYLPPPEARIFKSRSAPNSPLIGERRSLASRESPRLTRGLNQLSEKLASGKGAKSTRVGRSKSFHGKGMCLCGAFASLLYCIVAEFLCDTSLCDPNYKPQATRSLQRKDKKFPKESTIIYSSFPWKNRKWPALIKF